MHRKRIVDFLLIILFWQSIDSAIVTNLCPSSSSCNCTLVNDTNLSIICEPTVPLTELPTLNPNTYQTNVLQLQLSSSVTGIRGPLTSLPTNLCAYPNVHYLDLSYNSISQSFNISDLFCTNTKLQTIDFSSNMLTLMPDIDLETFVSFPQSIVSMDFSSNQIVSVDLWPLFVKTGSSMTIDMSSNLIQNYTNNVPISVSQFTSTIDPRYFNLNNNRLEYLSDLLVEQYGACSTTSNGRNYFIVAISNLLLTNNPLICDCQSYQLISYIQDWIVSFPEIYNNVALLNRAICSAPTAVAGVAYLSTDFSAYNFCENYTLPNISDIFCSLTPNSSVVTLVPPTYWTTTTTIRTTTNRNSQTENSSGSSWYIILGVVLGIVTVLAVIITLAYFLRSKFSTGKLTEENNLKSSYEQMIRNSDGSSDRNSKLNETKPRRASMSTSMNGINAHQGNNGKNQSGQETQTNFPLVRSKPPNGRVILSARRSQPRDPTNQRDSSESQRKFSLPIAMDAATNTVNVVKGIPILATAPKPPIVLPQDPSNGNPTAETNITPIPVTPSKRAKILPPLKKGIYDESTNENLLNTSAGALATSQRQRRRSLTWFRKQNANNLISPLPPRPNSMVTQKTNFDYEGSFDEDIPSIPTTEILSDKPMKPLRTVPLLNISVVPAWIGDDED